MSNLKSPGFIDRVIRSGAMSHKRHKFPFLDNDHLPSYTLRGDIPDSSTWLSCWCHVRIHDYLTLFFNYDDRIQSSSLRKPLRSHSRTTGSVSDSQTGEIIHFTTVEAVTRNGGRLAFTDHRRAIWWKDRWTVASVSDLVVSFRCCFFFTEKLIRVFYPHIPDCLIHLLRMIHHWFLVL